MSDNRLHYMDNLRAFAMLLGVLFHAAMAYSSAMHNIWLPADQNHSALVDIFFNLSHLFRMPLFFLVAGFFACLLYEKRGLRKLLTNRLVRVTVPLLVFLPLLGVAMIALIGWALAHVENKSPMLAIIALFAGNPDAPQSPPSTMHLWFLYYLTMFYVLTAVAVKLGRVNLLPLLAKKPLWFVLLAPLCLVPALALSGVPYPAPEQFVPHVWAVWFFGFFYLLGWLFYRHGSAVELFRPYWKTMLAISLALFAILYYLLPNESLTLEKAMAMAAAPRVISFNQVVLSILGAYVAVYLVLVLLIVGKDFFDRRSPAFRLIADSSYWIYLIHIPVLFAVQFMLMDVDWSLGVEFLVSSAVTFSVGLVSYLLLVRWTPIGWLLNGRKRSKKVEKALAVTPA